MNIWEIEISSYPLSLWFLILASIFFNLDNKNSKFSPKIIKKTSKKNFPQKCFIFLRSIWANIENSKFSLWDYLFKNRNIYSDLTWSYSDRSWNVHERSWNVHANGQERLGTKSGKSSRYGHEYRKIFPNINLSIEVWLCLIYTINLPVTARNYA